MLPNKRVVFAGSGLLLLLLAAGLFPAAGQGMQAVIHSRDRVFSAVGPGVAALKRDATGRYYILAQPATTIAIYDSSGRRVGQIPNANSGSATINYAVDIDLDSLGRLYVADRGANAIKIFAPEGSLVATVPVTAPTSVVALSDGQFAVTKLQSKRLVQIMDRRGAVIRTFGDPADEPGGASAEPVMDRGRITGDSGGNIYFAFTSLPDPTLQRFDRYGYSAYDAVVPAAELGELVGRNGRDIELGYSMATMGAPSITAWTDLHSVRASMGRTGARRGREGGAAAATAPGSAPSGTAPANAAADSPSGDASDSSAAALPGDAPSDVLALSSSSDSSDSSLLSGANGGLFGGGLGPGFAMPGLMGMGFGGGFHMGMHEGFGGFGGFGGEGDAGHPHFEGPPGGGEFDHFGHFHPGYGTYRATATLKIALDDPSKHKLEKPVITAVGVDPQTHEAWAAIGDMLAHFDSYGNRLDIYYVTITGDTTIKPSAILVEPDRILIASDPWGIYEFPRPDKPSSTPSQNNTIVPEQIPPAPSAPASTH